MRGEHVNYLHIIYMTACVVLVFGRFFFTILLCHIQYVYYVYGVTYMQVSVIEQICSYSIFHYTANVLTACFYMCLDILSFFNHNHFQLSIVCGSTLSNSTHTTLSGVCYLAITEYCAIINVPPMGPEKPPLLYYGLQNLYKISIDHLFW